MAKESRFSVHFSVDGSEVKINAGTTPFEAIGLTNMPAHARRHCFETGLELLIRNTVAGAAKAGWTDAQCHSYMVRKARSIVAGQLRLSESNADFMHLVTALLAVKGWAASRRGEMEAKLLAMTPEWRKAAEAKYRVEIAQARLEYAQSQAHVGAGADLLDDLGE